MRAPLIALLLTLMAWMAPARALESQTLTSPRATVSLVTDTDAATPGQAFRVGLYIRLAAGWHTYWKNPGDAGVPPELSLSLPQGGEAGPITWPVPQRISEGPLITYAYTGNVLLPVRITLAPAGGSLVKAHAEWLVCRDICVPEQGDFVLDIPPGRAKQSPQEGLFAAFDRAAARPSPWQSVVGKDGMLWVHGPELTPATVTDAWFIPDIPGAIRDSAAQPLTVREGSLTMALKLGKSFNASDGLSGILAVRDRSGRETDVLLHAGSGAVPVAPPAPALGRMLVLAFLGGVILNLMPCVFPVLALKLLGLAGTPREQAARQAIAYTAGVLVAFFAIGGALLAARALGSAAGWGFQFQSPVFVALMAWILFGVGLNLSGVYQIGTGLTRTGQGLVLRPGQLGSFFTGLLAVVVAAPCTAPFMGVAVAAGLAAPPGVTMLVFLTMGTGMAAPYAALALLPALAWVTPKPGRWMEILRQALAFPMYGASAWLIWVMSLEAGSGGVLVTAAGMVLLGFAAWVLGATEWMADRGRRGGQIAAIAAVLAAVALAGGLPSVPEASPARADSAETFTATRLAALRAEGRPVLVNMTAAWCVTCLVNERVAIDTTAVRHALAAHHVAYLIGDWTRQDPEVTGYLRQNGRDGVPLYIFYPPHDGTPTVLPQILTEYSLLNILDRADNAGPV